MKLFQLQIRDEMAVAVEIDRGLINLTAAWQMYFFIKKNRFMVKPQSLQDFIQQPSFSEVSLIKILDFLEMHKLWDQYLIKENYRIKAPVINPGKIIAIGLNYLEHAHEGGREVPDEPLFFCKAGSVVIGQDDHIKIPEEVGRIDHEIELAVIIGRKAARVPAKKASDYIAGYTIFNDITARDLQKLAKSRQAPWFRSKNFDTFGPMGPCMIIKRNLTEPVSLDMELRVNGITRQQSNTRNMIFKIPELIAYISNYLTLYPGDVISTGTPEGVGPLHPGDLIEAEIESIGVLKNRVVKWEESG